MLRTLLKSTLELGRSQEIIGSANRGKLISKRPECVRRQAVEKEEARQSF